MNNKTRGELVRKRILQEVRNHPQDLVAFISDMFGIFSQAVGNHIRRLEKRQG